MNTVLTGVHDPCADPQAEIARLNKVIDALIQHAESAYAAHVSDFGLFQTAVQLEEQVRARTAELESTLRENERITRQLRESEERYRNLTLQLQDQATHDPLTGLYNRHFLDVAIERELARAQIGGTPVAVIMADLDRFKLVNDRYGHPAGDEVLRAFGALIRRQTRSTDICCRYGGEEFVLVLPGLAEQQACDRAENLRKSIEATPIQLEGSTLNVTASFGLALFPQHGSTAQTLIDAADHALYRAKENGRNRTERAILTTIR